MEGDDVWLEHVKHDREALIWFSHCLMSISAASLRQFHLFDLPKKRLLSSSTKNHARTLCQPFWVTLDWYLNFDWSTCSWAQEERQQAQEAFSQVTFWWVQTSNLLGSSYLFPFSICAEGLLAVWGGGIHMILKGLYIFIGTSSGDPLWF